MKSETLEYFNGLYPPKIYSGFLLKIFRAPMLIQFYDNICSFFNQPISIDVASQLSTLPNDVIIEIFKNLNLSDLRCAAIVCRKFNEIQNLPSLWEIQAKYFGIKLKKKSSRTYKIQVRHIRLGKGRYDLFKNAVRFQRSLSDEERKVFCREVASYSPPNNFIKIHSKSGEVVFCSHIDVDRKIKCYQILETNLPQHPLKRRCFF